MKIAIDAMGGDNAPQEIVKGAVVAAHEIKGTLILVGQPNAIERHIDGPCPPNVMIHPATEVIEMEDKPMDALRRKKDSSIAVCVDLVKKGQADVVVSAGNTGAVTACSLLGFRQMEGIHRPAIATHMPGKHGQWLLLDAGASPDVNPEHLVEFALMGRAYASAILKKPDPKVHLLNIGEEAGKGNAFAKKAHDLLIQHPWFAGNIEGKDLFRHPCDVVVCDAFLGNVVLKTAEGVAEFIMSEFRAAVPSGPMKVLFMPVRNALAPMRKKLDYAEYGGMPLLGLNGVTIIMHGRSNGKATLNAIRQAARTVDSRLKDKIRAAVEATS